MMLGASGALHAQTAAQTIWSGVYTAAQADRGRALYGPQCGRCHGEMLEGVQDAQPLKGASFLNLWEGQSVGDLVQRTRNTMPVRTPGSLSAASATDIVAYLLQQNGAQPGKTELSSDPAVQSAIRITAFAPPAP